MNRASYLVVLMAMLLGATVSTADVIYSYTGPHFTTFVGAPGVDANNFFTGFFIVPTAFASNTQINNALSLASSFTFNDGVYTITSADAGVQILDQRILTDSAGNFVQWRLDLRAPEFGEMVLCNLQWGTNQRDWYLTEYCCGSDIPQASVEDLAYKANPGVWTMSQASVPEPGSLLLLGAGLAGLELGLRRKSCH